MEEKSSRGVNDRPRWPLRAPEMIILINFSRHSVAESCRRYIPVTRFASNFVVIEIYAKSSEQKIRREKDTKREMGPPVGCDLPVITIRRTANISGNENIVDKIRDRGNVKNVNYRGRRRSCWSFDEKLRRRRSSRVWVIRSNSAIHR